MLFEHLLCKGDRGYNQKGSMILIIKSGGNENKVKCGMIYNMCERAVKNHNKGS